MRIGETTITRGWNARFGGLVSFGTAERITRTAANEYTVETGIMGKRHSRDNEYSFIADEGSARTFETIGEAVVYRAGLIARRDER